MKEGNKVLFKTDSINFGLLSIGSGEAIGIIKDFDDDYIIIETGIGEHYINKKDIIRVLK